MKEKQHNYRLGGTIHPQTETHKWKSNTLTNKITHVDKSAPFMVRWDNITLHGKTHSDK